MSAPRAAIVTISTSKAAGGGGEDESGARLAALAEGVGAEVVARELIPDDRAEIERRLRHWAQEGCALILTTGGTGLAPSDLTPEATRSTKLK